MEYAYHLKPAQVLDTMRPLLSTQRLFAATSKYLSRTRQEGTLSSWQKLISAAVEEGATVISISDNAENLSPRRVICVFTSFMKKRPLFATRNSPFSATTSLHGGGVRLCGS
jgi:hypothetical protein